MEVITNNERDEIIFDSVKNKYQNNLKTLKGSEFVFDYVNSLHYKCQKISESYIDSFEWIKKQQ